MFSRDRFGDELHDFAETAAAMMNLDLVVSVDTAVAHLAGALGSHVWLLLHIRSNGVWMRSDPIRLVPDDADLSSESAGDWAPAWREVCGGASQTLNDRAPIPRKLFLSGTAFQAVGRERYGSGAAFEMWETKCRTRHFL